MNIKSELSVLIDHERKALKMAQESEARERLARISRFAPIKTLVESLAKEVPSKLVDIHFGAWSASVHLGRSPAFEYSWNIQPNYRSDEVSGFLARKEIPMPGTLVKETSTGQSYWGPCTDDIVFNNEIDAINHILKIIAKRLAHESPS